MGYGNGGSYGEATQAATVNLGPRDATARESLTASQTARLDKHLEALHHIINELDARLSAVLMPEPPAPPTGVGNAPSAPMPAVPLANMLAAMADRAGYACQRLQAVIGRIEV